MSLFELRRGMLRAVPFLTGLCLHVIGCTDPASTDVDSSATISASRVEANPENVLSAIVIVRAAGADSVCVELGTDAGLGVRTPAVVIRGDSARVPVLGLRPETAYNLRAVPSMKGVSGEPGPLLDFTTGTMPSDIPAFTITTNLRPSPGYVMFGLTSGVSSIGGFYALIVDNDGRVVWYRKFDGQIADVQRQPNGDYTVASTLGGAPVHFYELDKLGSVVAEYSASDGWSTDAHDLLLRGGGSILYGVKDSTMDLRSLSGNPSASVLGNEIEYRKPDGTFRWSTFDHLSPDEAASDVSLTDANVDPWHANAIDLDADGNLLASFRNSDEIIKVDARTGAIIWRLGGTKSDFTIVNDRLGGFSHQHGVRRLANGNIILFDNGNLHQPPESRAVEYRLDEGAKTAELVWEYRSDPPLFGFALGFADRIADGHTLICYGVVAHLIEVDAGKTRQWELAMNDPRYLVYRAFRIASLY